MDQHGEMEMRTCKIRGSYSSVAEDSSLLACWASSSWHF